MKVDSLGIYREQRNIQGVDVEFRGGCIGDPFVKKFGAFVPGTTRRLTERDYVVSIDDEEDEGGFENAFENHVVGAFTLDLEAKLSKARGKKLMLLGGIRYLLPVIEAAHKLGAYVITADYLPDNIAHKYSDEYVNVSIIDREAVLKVAREKQIDGILSFGVDPGVVTAAYVADKMGLPSPPLASVEILQNKDKFRDFLEANGFNCPKRYQPNDEIEYPVIVKPVDSAGSKGCSRVDSPSELASAIEYARSESHSGRIIIEQFLELAGRQTGSDCFSVNNELVYCTFGSQYFDVGAGNDYAPIANVWPAVMPHDKQLELRTELQRLVELLDLGTTILNVETRVATNGKAYIMEVSPRGGGNRIAEVLRYATNQDLIMANVCAALGMNDLVCITEAKYNGAWAYYVLHSSKNGTLLTTVGIEVNFKRAHVVELDEWFSPGDRVSSFTGANQSLGTMILKFDNSKDAEQSLTTSKDWLSINVA